MACWMNIYYIILLAWAVFYFFMSLRAGRLNNYSKKVLPHSTGLQLSNGTDIRFFRSLNNSPMSIAEAG